LKESIKLGIFGLGTVGKGVVEQLRKNGALISQRLGKELQITKAVTANPTKDRGIDLSDIQISSDPKDILDDPEIDIVLELIGGVTDAKSIVLEALQKGKSVVTANKALLAECTEEIFNMAYQSKGLFGFEASVAGCIPVIREIKSSYSGEKIEEISGIINGTANYILTSMIEDKADFQVALKAAQDKGYAEADPAFDIEGTDTAHKLIILMDLAFNGLFDLKELYVEGITKITPLDIEIAEQFGYTIKLLGKAVNTDKGFEGRVHPTLVKTSNMLASVRGAFNAVAIKGNFMGPTLSYGAGAGAYPTASAVMGDVIEISRNLLQEAGQLVPPLASMRDQLSKKKILPMSEVTTEYYLRFSVLDEVGVMSKITTLLGENDIGIRSMLQKGEAHSPKDPIHVVIFTHKAIEKNILKALAKIDSLQFVAEPTNLIRIDTE